MKRVWAGIGLLATAGLGTAMLATPSGASEDPPEFTPVQLKASWSPNPAQPGEAVTLSSEEPCTFDVDPDNENNVSKPGIVLLASDINGDGNIGEGETFQTPMNDDGSWSFDWTAPDEAKVYSWDAMCQNSTFEEKARLCGLDNPEMQPDLADEGFKNVSYTRPLWKRFADCNFEFYHADLTVGSPSEESTTTTTMPETTPPPATPIPEAPHQTG